jgi:glycine/D-amino acid oxidase-like deaminating enzyme
MNSSHFDAVIVGQGLAGSAVALQLLKKRKKILVIDETSRRSSSRVAIGLFNPITGRNSVKTWMADVIFPTLFAFYREAEKLTQEKFFHPMPLYKPFKSIEEQNEWMSRTADPIYDGYVEQIFTHSAFDGIRDSFGGMLLKQSGYLDTIRFLESVRKLISREALLIDEAFDEDMLTPLTRSIRYKKYSADCIIFCQGVQSCKWFKWVPILPLKGETIRIESSYRENNIINRGVYAVPVDPSGTWRVGATYSLTDQTAEITEAGRAELISKLDELVSFPYQVVDQEWGLRPTTHDRRPVLGRHPEHESMYIFNGLGPKGVSLAPYFSHILVNDVENGQPLDKVVDLKRYKLLYWSPSTRI